MGADEVWAIDKIYFRHLAEIGADVLMMPAHSRFLQYYQTSLNKKILYRLGLSGIIRKINQDILAVVEDYKPDIVWVFKGMETLPSTLRTIKSRRIKLVNYNPDNPFVFSGRGSGNANITESIGLYDLHFTYDRSIQKLIEDKYRLPVQILPFGYELTDKEYGQILAGNADECRKACFLGNPDKIRAADIKSIADYGIEIDLFGHNWDKFVSHPNISCHGPVYRGEFWQVLRRYRMQLNFMRPHNPHSHNMRTFEVPGVGGILVAPDTIDHREYFVPGEEIFIYNNLKDCAETIRTVVGFSDREANEVRTRARAASEMRGYSYRSRAEMALNYMKQII